MRSPECVLGQLVLGSALPIHEVQNGVADLKKDLEVTLVQADRSYFAYKCIEQREHPETVCEGGREENLHRGAHQAGGTPMDCGLGTG